jgi:hypothetical protein
MTARSLSNIRPVVKGMSHCWQRSRSKVAIRHSPSGAISGAGVRVMVSSGQTSAQRMQSSLQVRAKCRVRCRSLSAKVMSSATLSRRRGHGPDHSQSGSALGLLGEGFVLTVAESLGGTGDHTGGWPSLFQTLRAEVAMVAHLSRPIKADHTDRV